MMNYIHQDGHPCSPVNIHNNMEQALLKASTGQGSGNNKTHWEVQEEVDFRVQVVVAVAVTVAVAVFL